ncbi:hypothetical protein ANCCEY_13503 [Ancylostoma ceylanicum]|uniref:Leucine Rich repeat-containing domain protein n=1 Tax=Ancylostoma ceylanicum TaxID=53326 RepID=A0A0D6L6V9_9BILA|nr:hypothetical protein ANCCEY_13503 [Ancylostoma ceylanicum]
MVLTLQLIQCRIDVTSSEHAALAASACALSSSGVRMPDEMFMFHEYGHLYGTESHENPKDLQENRISVIRRNDLRHLKQLKILQLMDNHVHSIEEGAFSELEALERLRLNRNRLRLLPDKIFAENKNLHRL